MKLSEFKFSVPKNAVAKEPASPRDSAKMMVLNRETGEIEDKKFSDLLSYMKAGDVIVVNDLRVRQGGSRGRAP